MKNGKLLVKLEDESGVDDQEIEKSMNQMPCHLVSYIFGLSNRLKKNVIQEMDGFYSNTVYYADTDGAYIHKKHWSTLVDNGFFGNFVGLGKKDYSNAGLFYASFLAPKIKFCVFNNDYGLISAKRSFKGFSKENRMIKLDDFISLSEGKSN